MNFTASTLYDLFYHAAKKYPNNRAVCFKNGICTSVVSYEDVLRECTKVYSTLNEYGVKSGFVGVFMEQSLCSPTILLGILRAGLAFTCLDPEYKEQNLNVLKDLNIQWIFSGSTEDHECLIFRKEISIHGHNIALLENDAIDTSLHSEIVYDSDNWRMAYTIQTSGTTGQPKIIRVPHRCIVPNIQHLQLKLSVKPSDVIFLAAPSTFDPSIVELFLALSAGALILIVPRVVKLSPDLLLKALFSDTGYEVTILEATPSFVTRWSKEEIQRTLLSEKSLLRVLVLGGEPCPSIDILRQWKAKGNNTDIFNIYGITEVSCWATIQKITIQKKTQLCNYEEYKTQLSTGSKDTRQNQDYDAHREEAVPLGDALSHTLLKVENETGQEIFDGEGELYIGSMERICLTNNETVQNLRLPVYRATGDIVKLDGSNKKLFYIGRRNDIIKRFGHRVCLNQIEQVATSQGYVEQTCCLWDTHIKKLGLFVRLEKSKEDDYHFHRTLKLNLIKSLQPACVPDVIINLKSFPLTNHGKIDHLKLKCLLTGQIQKDMTRLSEMRDINQAFSLLWSQYLCMDSYPNPDDNFFQCGGNSVLALQLVSEVEKLLQCSRPNLVGLLLGSSTFEKCCAYLCTPELDNSLSKRHGDVTQHFLQEERLRKRLNSLEESINDETVKHFKPEGLEISVVNRTADLGNDSLIQSNADNDVHISSCRGKIEKFGKQPEACFFSSFNKIKLEIKWKFSLGKCVDASPRFLQYKSGEERVLVGAHSHIFANINSKTGELVSECNLMDRIESSMCVSPCGKFGVVGSYNGFVYCIELSTSVVTWSYHTQGIVKSSPVLCLKGSAIIVGSYDQLLYCITIQDGHLIWSTKVGAGSIFSSPCVTVTKQVVYVAALDGTCICLAENDGHILWNRKADSPVFSSPAVLLDENAVLFAEVSGIVHCFSVDDGKELWNFQAGGNIFSSFCIHPAKKERNTNLIMFGCHDRNVYCLEGSIRTVELRWTCELESSVFSTPFVFPVVITSGVLKVDKVTLTTFHKEKYNLYYLIAVASTNGKMYILDLDSGVVKCYFQLPGEVFSSPVVNRNLIYVGCRDNNVYSLNIKENS